jgi:hypothetical protein
MNSRHEVKLALQRRATELGLSVTGLHSVRVVDDVVDIIFDCSPDLTGDGLHFCFSLPQAIAKDDVRRFAEWLASPEFSGDMTMH